MLFAILHFVLALALAPLLLGVINRAKALAAGRRGQPLLQLYFDLWKLLQKGAVYSQTTTWVFRAGPVVGLAAVLVALALVPCAGRPGLLTFPGDLLLFAYVLALLRFFLVAAALDTGSAFEGMGASREEQFSTLAEPALLLGLAALGRLAGNFSLAGIYGWLDGPAWVADGPALALVVVAFLVVLLTETARVPVDDPNTHLELTMIHEVMVLDHGGPDFAFIQYTAALKLWALGALLMGVVLPVHPGGLVLDLAAGLGGLLLLAVLIGLIESTMARWRLVRLPHFLLGATICSALAAVLALLLE